VGSDFGDFTANGSASSDQTMTVEHPHENISKKRKPSDEPDPLQRKRSKPKIYVSEAYQ
jgi:hypothetical protein